MAGKCLCAEVACALFQRVSASWYRAQCYGRSGQTPINVYTLYMSSEIVSRKAALGECCANGFDDVECGGLVEERVRDDRQEKHRALLRPPPNTVALALSPAPIPSLTMIVWCKNYKTKVWLIEGRRKQVARLPRE